MDLVNDQQTGNTSNYFSTPNSTPLSLPVEIPQYSTQYGIHGGESEPNPVENTTNRREARPKWNPHEDIVLISAWLNTSKDPIVGNDQKTDAFWKRVANYYQQSPAVANLPRREARACKQRWFKINGDVSKFVGDCDQACKLRTSGQSEDVVVKATYQIFFSDEKRNFNLEHAWRELRHDKKWCSTLTQSSESGGSSKRTKLNEGGLYYSSSNPESPINLEIEEQTMARPLRVKRSKHKGKKVVTNILEEEKEASSWSRLENMWAMKEKDNENQRKFSRMELLNSLLLKTGPLSEKEEILKNKLIDEMM